MPIPRKEGANLSQINLVMPASLGLNKQAETNILGPEWATQATNAIFDTSGRLAARQGWFNQTTSPISGNPITSQIFELVKKDGTTQIISSANGKLYLGVSTPTDITGTATTTAGNNWQFINAFGSVYGVQQGAVPIVYNGTTSFANLSAASGTLPQGNCGVFHSGRLWIAGSDLQTIQYSALLDPTKWATADGAGSIDMTSVWPGSTDQIVALAFYNGKMFVFGKNRIVIWADNQGSALGLNPNNMYVYDTVIGTGCIARDSVQQIEGGDILFLSAQGLESIARLVVYKSNPLDNPSKHIRDYLRQNFVTATTSSIRSVYSPENAFYLLSIPSSSVTFCFSTQFPNQDGSLRVTEWSNFVPTAMCRAIDGTLYATLGTTTGFTSAQVGGQIGIYSGYQDAGMSYTLNYLSGWMDGGQDVNNYLKLLKSITALMWVSNSASLNINWGFDFDPNLNSFPISLSSTGSSEWGLMEYGLDEWSGGQSLTDCIAPCGGSGQFFRVGASSAINGQSFALQQFNVYAKIGRMAR